MLRSFLLPRRPALPKFSIELKELKKNRKIPILPQFEPKTKFQKHFPVLYRKLLSENTKETEEKIDWQDQFEQACTKEYGSAEDRLQNFFYRVKEGNCDFLEQEELAWGSLFKKDKNQKTLVEWAIEIHDQAMMDAFYIRL